MNERIKQLAEQAGIHFRSHRGSTLDAGPDGIAKFVLYSDMEKFAELIIQECMDCSLWVGKMNKNAVEPIHTAHAINLRIKKHLGFEE